MKRLLIVLTIWILLFTSFSFADTNDEVQYTVKKEYYFDIGGEFWIPKEEFVRNFGTNYPFEQKTFMNGEFICLKNSEIFGVFVKETTEGLIISKHDFGHAKKTDLEKDNSDVLLLREGDYLIEKDVQYAGYYGIAEEAYKLLVNKDLFTDYFGTTYPLEIINTVRGEYLVIKDNLPDVYILQTEEGLLLSKNSFENNNYFDFKLGANKYDSDESFNNMVTQLYVLAGVMALFVILYILEPIFRHE